MTESLEKRIEQRIKKLLAKIFNERTNYEIELFVCEKSSDISDAIEEALEIIKILQTIISEQAKKIEELEGKIKNKE